MLSWQARYHYTTESVLHQLGLHTHYQYNSLALTTKDSHLEWEENYSFTGYTTAMAKPLKAITTKAKDSG
jgi:hypothetical protein